MVEWWRRDWLPRHVAVAPFGVFLISLLLGLWSEGGQWQSDKIMEAAAKFVDLAAVIYGMIAVSVERGGRLMFWALDQRRQWREKWRKEIEDEVRAETEREMQAVRAETEQRVRAESRQMVQSHLEQVAREEGIPLERLMPPNKEG